jgi:hypothetical protein
VWLPATHANQIGLGAEASCCGSRLVRIGSHSWDSGRLLWHGTQRPPSVGTTCCAAGLVVIILGSRVRHDALCALRGLFYLVGMLLALRGLFFLVDMSLPVVHSAVTSPFVAFFLSGPLPLSVVEFVVWCGVFALRGCPWWAQRVASTDSLLIAHRCRSCTRSPWWCFDTRRPPSVGVACCLDR